MSNEISKIRLLLVEAKEKFAASRDTSNSPGEVFALEVRGRRLINQAIDTMDLATRHDQRDWAIWGYTLVNAFCPFQAKEDGTCTHEQNLTPECHPGACPLISEDLLAGEIADSVLGLDGR